MGYTNLLDSSRYSDDVWILYSWCWFIYWLIVLCILASER